MARLNVPAHPPVPRGSDIEAPPAWPTAPTSPIYSMGAPAASVSPRNSYYVPASERHAHWSAQLVRDIEIMGDDPATARYRSSSKARLNIIDGLTQLTKKRQPGRKALAPIAEAVEVAA